QRGKFTAGDTEVVASVMQAFLAGLAFYAICNVIGRAFIAGRSTWRLALLSPVTLVLKVILIAILLPMFGLAGIAMAGTIGYGLFAMATGFLLVRKISWGWIRSEGGGLIRIGIALSLAVGGLRIMDLYVPSGEWAGLRVL